MLRFYGVYQSNYGGGIQYLTQQGTDHPMPFNNKPTPSRLNLTWNNVFLLAIL